MNTLIIDFKNLLNRFNELKTIRVFSENDRTQQLSELDTLKELVSDIDMLIEYRKYDILGAETKPPSPNEFTNTTNTVRQFVMPLFLLSLMANDPNSILNTPPRQQSNEFQTLVKHRINMDNYPPVD